MAIPLPSNWRENIDHDPVQGSWCMVLDTGDVAVVHTEYGSWDDAYLYKDSPRWAGFNQRHAVDTLYWSLKSKGLATDIYRHGVVLFLDIDGVLNHQGIYDRMEGLVGKNQPRDWLDPDCITRVNRVCHQTGARVVVSSSWKKYLSGGVEGVTSVLRSQGFHATVIGGTPSFETPGVIHTLEEGTRWKEILHWLGEHKEFETWAILDDCPYAGFPPDRFVKTNLQTGITGINADRLIHILGA